MSEGFGGARASDAMQKEFTTINKDGKTVWEPGLPATVTARRQHRPQKAAPVVDEVPVTCDLRLTLKMPGSSKAEWLEKALKAMPGKAKVQDVFNIITHPKFSSGVAEKYGKRMLQTVAESMDLFSDKQRITLSRCKLVELFQPGGAGEAKDDDSGDETPPEAPKMPKRRKRSRSRSHKRRSPSPAKKPALQNAASPSRGRPDISKSREANEEEDPDWKERYRKQEEEKRRAEAEKKAQQDREAKRKAKLGAAFQLEDEDDAANARAQLASKLSERKDELPSLAMARASAGRDADPRFVEAMGGDKLLQEAHKILRSAAGSGRLGATSRSRSRSRSRRRRRERSASASRDRGRRPPNVRSSGSYRSPTPDGRARGQARAARKAKMIASLMGIR